MANKNKEVKPKNSYFVSVDKLYTLSETKKEDSFSVSPMRARIKRNGKYGFINERGQEIIPPTYDDAGEFVAWELGFYAKVRLDGKQGFIDVNGETVVPIIYDDITGFLPVYFDTADEDLFGRIEDTP